MILTQQNLSQCNIFRRKIKYTLIETLNFAFHGTEKLVGKRVNADNQHFFFLL